MVNAILDLAKLDAGEAVLEATAFDPAGLACAIAEDHELAAAARRNALTVNRRDLGEAIGDCARLGECLASILSNACKCTEDGRVTLDMRRESDAHGDWLMFEIADTGIGVAPDHLDRLFKPFGQVDASKTRTYEGAGVGLAKARGLARLMGGDITVASELGRGSTFTLRAPANLTRSAKNASAAA
jgi:signal transduction histidine kinase